MGFKWLISGDLDLLPSAVDFLSPKSSLSRVASGCCSPPSTSCTSSGVASSDSYLLEITSLPNEDQHKPCSQKLQADEADKCEIGASIIEQRASGLCSITLPSFGKGDINSDVDSACSNVNACVHGPQEVDPAVWSDHFSEERGRCGRIGFARESDDHHSSIEAPTSSRIRSSSVPKGPELQCSHNSKVC